MPVIFQRWIERSDLELNPDVLYVFGDNNTRKGMGGLAKACRGRPNAVGVRTKKYPTMERIGFLNDDEYEQNVEWINNDLQPVLDKLEIGGTVIFPTAPLGSGLAELSKRAPKTYAYLRDVVENLADKYTDTTD